MAATLDKLVYMANQIAREFRNQLRSEAAQATYDHLWHFWDPRMREMIIAHLERGGEDLDETARDAIQRLAASRSEPRPVTQATQFSGVGDSEMSDAG